MQNIEKQITAANWTQIAEEMHAKGYAILPGILDDAICEELKENYDQPGAYRKTVIMEHHKYGLGAYKYFQYQLPDVVQELRTVLYPQLAPIANTWMNVLKISTQFPPTHAEMLENCHANQQVKPTPLILKYGKSGYNALHQDLYGAIYFPLQVVIVLSEPGKDFTGGEFVLTEQTPRAQSKAIVLNPNKGDLLIFTTNFRPAKSTRGFQRVNMRHGVSEVLNGERFTLGIIFHDAS